MRGLLSWLQMGEGTLPLLLKITRTREQEGEFVLGFCVFEIVFYEFREKLVIVLWTFRICPVRESG